MRVPHESYLLQSFRRVDATPKYGGSIRPGLSIVVVAPSSSTPVVLLRRATLTFHSHSRIFLPSPVGLLPLSPIALRS